MIFAGGDGGRRFVCRCHVLDRLSRFRRNQPGRGHERLRQRHERSSLDRLAETAVAQVQAAGSRADAPPFEGISDRRSRVRLPVQVVITHTAVHWNSDLPKYRTIRSRRVRVGLSAMMERYRPTLWVHGHVHNSCDYLRRAGDPSTRIVCNAHGYGRRTPSSTAASSWRSNDDVASLSFPFLIPYFPLSALPC